MEDFLGYMLFSLCEGIAVYAFIFYIFRLNMMHYIWHVLLIVTVTNIQSYVIREELSLLPISPVINLIITILFLIIVIKIPVIWSMVMAITGYIAFVLIQSAIIFLSFGFITPSETHDHIWKTYLGQFLAGVISFTIAWFLYKRGYGFTYEFEKLRLRWERIFILSVNIAFLLALVAMMAYKVIFINLLVLGIALAVFFVYSLIKEEQAK
jgi:hypothetical protein